MSTATPSHPLADVSGMFVIHRAFRREFGMLPTLIRNVAPSDTARAEVVAAHLDLVLAGLHMHHTGEDEVLWPLLLEREAPSTQLVETMQAQHDGIDVYSDQVELLSAEWRKSAWPVRGEQLARVIEKFREALLEHLGLEEDEILPLAARCVTAEEWDRMGGHGIEVMTKAQRPLLFGAILEEADAREREMMLASLPRVVRVLLTTVGRVQYSRYINRVRGA